MTRPVEKIAFARLEVKRIGHQLTTESQQSAEDFTSEEGKHWSIPAMSWTVEKTELTRKSKMPQNVPLIIIAVFCYTGGSLGQVQSAYNGGFVFDALSEPCDGQHFMDVLPSLTQIVRRYIPGVGASGQNAVCAVNFQMQKGNVFDFGRNTQQIVCGLGWDTTFGQVDLDVSCVLMDQTGEVLETVFFGNLRSERPHSAVGAVVHTGDNLTGEGSGDDEQIILNMNQIGPSVFNVFFVINIYT
ncbi:conserved hypothetical protein [Perkinsus marinus ATCC 50983]|uniref:TerD domain-containing protein n=1 Tax=Perkinsus marinus (strain ATCC 50983 / TXsc) TaxID=423536 RepID=C5LXL7_PERM5|nr:conserved hypothetical protein [Perkinsus marinus ATCC 50983]EEQ98539.1 conserved hypothetical protein [Perkinsus marinus ATCC 50983]|eukprot:XP_002765822.1 conserved hypothetical protein [Perkinsus marinus ATCC 50983]